MNLLFAHTCISLKLCHASDLLRLHSPPVLVINVSFNSIHGRACYWMADAPQHLPPPRTRARTATYAPYAPAAFYPNLPPRAHSTNTSPPHLPFTAHTTATTHTHPPRAARAAPPPPLLHHFAIAPIVARFRVVGTVAEQTVDGGRHFSSTPIIRLIVRSARACA